MTNDQFAELKSLILENSAEIKRNREMIRINYEMIGRMYEEHSGRFNSLEERLDRVEREVADFRAEWRSTPSHFENRLRALEN